MPHWRLPLFALLLAAVLALSFHPQALGGPGSATGSANVRLVRLLSEVPQAFRSGTSERLHDLRVSLVHGDVLLFRKGREFAAVLPLERVEGHPDSLLYFYYVERPSFWFFSGARIKGIRSVGEAGKMQFDTFRLLWGGGTEGLGWVYFPDAAENEHLRFSVVSGQSVDQADPKDTKYWIELGSEAKAGF